MKPLSWPRLLFTALVLGFLFGILTYARGQSPPRLDWGGKATRAKAAGLDWGTCHTAKTSPAQQPRTKRAADGGPDWQQGADGTWYRYLPSAPAPAPVYYPAPAFYPPPMRMMGGFGGGACVGGG